MVDDPAALPEWERLLAAERHLRLLPGAVLVGGTAAALHAGHRASHDGDHVLVDLRERFDEVLTALECAAGWRTERVLRPVLVLGSMDGVMTGIRQLRRTQPLETERIAGLCVPTLAEMARIKAWLLATRHTVRDYLDTVVLFERLGETGAVAAMREFDAIYRQLTGASSRATAPRSEAAPVATRRGRNDPGTRPGANGCAASAGRGRYRSPPRYLAHELHRAPRVAVLAAARHRTGPGRHPDRESA